MLGWLITIAVAVFLYLLVLGLTGSGIFALIVGLLTLVGFGAGIGRTR